MQHNIPLLITQLRRLALVVVASMVATLTIPVLSGPAAAQQADRGELADTVVDAPADAPAEIPDAPAAPVEGGLIEGSTPGAQPETAPVSGDDPPTEELTEQADLLHWRRHGHATKELVITEVMANPQVTYDSLGEWFEIYNPYNRAIQLNGWVIGDLGFDEHVITSDRSILIEAGGYVVMGNNPDTTTNGGVTLDYSYGAAVKLFNSVDAVILQRPRGDVAARVAWDDGVSFPDPNGESMSLTDFWLDDEVAANWCVSTSQFGAGDLGTPGAANNCTQPASIVITEIMQNPNATSDSAGEWFEVMNTGDVPVDLAGWTIHDDDDDSHLINASVPVGIGERVVLARNADTDINGGVSADYAFGDDIKLFNSFDELVLVDPAGLRSDRVKWNDGRSFPDPTGASMSVIDERADNEDSQNWCTSATTYGRGDMGTPGAPNSCSVGSGEQGPNMVITEIMRNPDVVSDSVGEWFEVYNPNPFNVDLQGWVVRDHDSNFHTIDASTIVAPNTYAVLGRSADHSGPAHAYVYDNVILHNGSDEIVLVNPGGVIVDQVIWNDAHFPSAAGVSMAVASLALNNDAGESWCGSTPSFGDGDFGTPGTETICDSTPSESTLVISEMMANPYASYDSSGEWFEIHNFGPVTVDLQGYTVKDEDFNEFVIDAPLPVEAGGFAVLARLGDPALNGGVEANYVYGTEMVLINSGDELVVLDTERKVVDRLVWGAGIDFAIPSGSSLQVVDVAADNFARTAWCEAEITMSGGDAGTPGRATNCDPEPDDENYEPEYEHARCSRRNSRAIIGTDGDDVLTGTSGADVFVALRGDDVINGGGGNDIICAGPGNDTIDAGTGNDIVLGGSGKDDITAGAGNDWVFAGRGNDVVSGGSGNDSISLGSGNDTVNAGSGDDKIAGNRGTDTIDGDSGIDTCVQGENVTNCER